MELWDGTRVGAHGVLEYRHDTRDGTVAIVDNGRGQWVEIPLSRLYVDTR